MYELTEYLTSRGVEIVEGSTSEEERRYLARVAREVGALSVGEVGFNAGYSAHALLESKPDLTLVSFDIGKHACVQPAKEFIDQKFPGRHTLILGDSRETVSQYQVETPFDLVFIDGGHSYGVAKADILNLRRLCRPEATVVMDDVIPWKTWGIGPALAWWVMKFRGVVTQEELYKDGSKVRRVRPPGNHAWARGQYTDDPR
jgi:predicted O-methyltransferase YrrM